MSFKDRKFGRLTIRYAVDERDRVLRYAPYAERFYCDCKCGNELVVWRSLLANNVQRDCGMCVVRCPGRTILSGYSACGHARMYFTKSGMRKWYKSGEYHTWQGMCNRCRCKGNLAWENYGGRGIHVCARWSPNPNGGRHKDSQGFKNFLADMGPRPFGKTLDRIDPCGHYEPTNCRWADQETQIWNQRRFVYPNGEPPVENTLVMELRVQEAYDWEAGVPF